MLLVPGIFWHGEMAERIARFSEAGMPVRVLLYDLFPITNPDWYPADGPAFERALDRVLPTCDRIVTMSDEVAAQLVARYPSVAGRVRVAVPHLHAHSPHPPAAASAPPIAGPFLLALSTVEPRKNLRVILDAWALAREDPRAERAQLVIAGRRGWLSDDLEAEIARDLARQRIIRLVAPADDVVDGLYATCLATIHASWAEGLGLPARESIARGIPTLMSSRIPTEGLPAGTFQTFDPGDAPGLADLMREVIANPPRRRPVATGAGTGWEPVLSALVD